MTIIDAHAHIGRDGEYERSSEILRQYMKRFNISKCIISNLEANEFDANGHPLPNQMSQIEANDATYSICRKNSEFKALFWIKPYYEYADSRLGQYLTERKNSFVGIKVHPKGSKTKFTIENYYTYLQLCAQFLLPMCVHTEADGFSNIEYVYEVAKAYPNINFIAENMELNSDHKNAYKYISMLPNLYGNTANLDAQEIIHAVKECTSEKIIFASNTTAAVEKDIDKYINYSHIEEAIGKENARNIFYNNAVRLFRL